ncbi:MAG TPA: EAL domain-containing protein [Reyranella sp.]|nr:EAL domain-containing protein [Reyranella sp.]
MWPFLKVLNCITTEHDLRLVGLAVVICALASITAINLLHHVRGTNGHMRLVWLAVSATTTGFGIWATHFIAMLAFSPGIPNAYNILLTGISLIAAILLTGTGLAVALAPIRMGTWLGGTIVGGGIAAMHYIGMAAFEIQGRIVWDPTLVAASIVLGGLLGAAALAAGLHSNGWRWRVVGALLLTLAICSHHFTAMAAASIIPDPTIEVSDTAVPSGLLAIAVALASFMIFLLALAGVGIEVRDRRRGELENDRMRRLANAAVEGLLICDGETIVTVNDSFVALAGLPAAAMTGAKLERCFPEEETRLKLLQGSGAPIEADLLRADGSRTPVELVLRPVDFAGKPHRAIAVRDIQARKQAEQRIRFLALHDTLTGLPNRSAFNRKLDHDIEAALAMGRPLAVMCLDLDRFKEVNDLFGHAAGDETLQIVAQRIVGMLDDSQTLARLSGDEFAIIVPAISGPAMAGRIAENIMESLRVSNQNSETHTPVSVSIGIAICPEDATDRQTLLTHADTALYRAKNEGRGTYRFFEMAMGAAVRDRRQLEHDLRHAGERGELGLVYQPQKDIRSGTVVGFEALVRWQHPTRGELLPDLFIPIAEETGLILQIGEWVLRTACREAASWVQPLTIAVNVSAIQIHAASFPQTVQDILFETRLPPGRLELEITETAMIRDLGRALATLSRIKTLGAHVVMDDFGTGYSSLANLRAFPFDKIKIDGSFIKAVNVNDGAATIVRAVLGLGRGLGMPVVAEGVETPSELEFLKNESCAKAQGFFLGAPADIASFRQTTHGGAQIDAGPNVIPLVPKA